MLMHRARGRGGGGEGGCLYRNLYSKKIVQQQVTEDISDVVIYGL